MASGEGSPAIPLPGSAAAPRGSAHHSADPTQRTNRRRRPRWALVGVAVVVLIAVVSTTYFVTLPPPPPFHQLWTRTLAGNSYGQGAEIGGLFVTYSYTLNQPSGLAASQGGEFADVNFTFEAINPEPGTQAWSAPVSLLGVAGDGQLFSPQVVSSGSVAGLAVTWTSATDTNLTVLSVTAASGAILDEWSMPLQTTTSVQLVVLDGELIEWSPLTLGSSAALEVYAMNLTTGDSLWTDGLPLPGLIENWAANTAAGQGVDDELVLGVNPTAPGAGAAISPSPLPQAGSYNRAPSLARWTSRRGWRQPENTTISRTRPGRSISRAWTPFREPPPLRSRCSMFPT